MANTMRWRYGETNPVMVDVAEGVLVEIGDLVVLVDCECEPVATSVPPQESKTFFLGVAMQSSIAGEQTRVRVATTGVFEFDAVQLDVTVGDLVEPRSAQSIGLAPSDATAVGRIASSAAATDKVLVDIVSTVMRGGVRTPEAARA